VVTCRACVKQAGKKPATLRGFLSIFGMMLQAQPCSDAGLVPSQAPATASTTQQIFAKADIGATHQVNLNEHD
jgi:hypothetical protein